mmetsp:Transcript_31551/g.44794  ORF Transcript_31551/g.44794 Transcript_31551/m.44794 type:complete len:81 (-) Transcript_31551:1016-1258(-)
MSPAEKLLRIYMMKLASPGRHMKHAPHLERFHTISVMGITGDKPLLVLLSAFDLSQLPIKDICTTPGPTSTYLEEQYWKL